MIDLPENTGNKQDKEVGLSEAMISRSAGPETQTFEAPMHAEGAHVPASNTPEDEENNSGDDKKYRALGHVRSSIKTLEDQVLLKVSVDRTGGTCTAAAGMVALVNVDPSNHEECPASNTDIQTLENRVLAKSGVGSKRSGAAAGMVTPPSDDLSNDRKSLSPSNSSSKQRASATGPLPEDLEATSLDIQPLPLEVQNMLRQSQPGAYATIRQPTGAPPVAAMSEASGGASGNDGGSPPPLQDEETGQDTHLVEASLVETPPMAEIVHHSMSSSDGPGAALELLPKEAELLEKGTSSHCIPSSPRIKCLCLGASVLVVLGIIALAVAGIVCGTGSCGQGDSGSADEDALGAIVIPISSVDVSKGGTFIQVPLANSGAYIGLPNYTIPSLQDASTAQAKALHWLSTEYGSSTLQSMQGWRKRQIFVMASIYFSYYDGEEEEDNQDPIWLDASEPECFWDPERLANIWLIRKECSDTGRITTLHLSDFQSKPIPREVALLHHLNVFVIEHSGLIGSLEELLPQEFVSSVGNSLQELSIINNALTGSIPAYLMELTKLQTLELFKNQISGTLPTEVAMLSDLTTLSIFGNQLTGNLPSQLGLATKLQYVSAIWNEFTGTIPTELGLLKELKSLSMFDNKLEGSLPTEVTQLFECQMLDLAKNALSFTLPTELGLLTAMTHLTLFDNQFSGSLPTELGQLVAIQYLDPAANQLSGLLPTELGSLTQITKLSLYENKISGTIPTEFSQLTLLEHLWLQENDLSGMVPEGICSMTQDNTLYDLSADCLSEVLCPANCSCSFCQ